MHNAKHRPDHNGFDSITIITIIIIVIRIKSVQKLNIIVVDIQIKCHPNYNS